MIYLTREQSIYTWWAGTIPPTPIKVHNKGTAFLSMGDVTLIGVASSQDKRRVPLNNGECKEMPHLIGQVFSRKVLRNEQVTAG
jgi:hypothetical protein